MVLVKLGYITKITTSASEYRRWGSLAFHVFRPIVTALESETHLPSEFWILYLVITDCALHSPKKVLTTIHTSTVVSWLPPQEEKRVHSDARFSVLMHCVTVVQPRQPMLRSTLGLHWCYLLWTVTVHVHDFFAAGRKVAFEKQYVMINLWCLLESGLPVAFQALWKQSWLHSSSSLFPLTTLTCGPGVSVIRFRKEKHLVMTNFLKRIYFFKCIVLEFWNSIFVYWWFR